MTSEFWMLLQRPVQQSIFAAMANSPTSLSPHKTVAIVAALVSLTCACGIPIGPQDRYPPPSLKRSLRLNYPSLYLQARVGSSSAPVKLSLENISHHPVGLSRPTLYAIHYGEAFHLDTTCGDALAPAATCFIILTFTPTTRHDSEARLLFSAQPAESYGLIVSGIAVDPR
jgi:hypothetical protein